MRLDLKKSDLYRLGHTIFGKDGYTIIAFDINDEAYGVSIILLRNILLLWGDGYRIVGTEDMLDENLNGDVWVQTNLPYEFLVHSVEIDSF